MLIEEQAGFPPGRSYGNQICTRRIIIKECIRWQNPNINCIDFKKTFDSIHCDSFWNILMYQGEACITHACLVWHFVPFQWHLAQLQIDESATAWAKMAARAVEDHALSFRGPRFNLAHWGLSTLCLQTKQKLEQMVQRNSGVKPGCLVLSCLTLPLTSL